MASFLLLSLDDVFWDIGYYLRRKRVKGRLRIEELDRVPRRLLAILIPAWREAGIIGPMVENLLQSVSYPRSLLHIFIGVYPNDVATLEEVRRLESCYPQVHGVINPREGPTNKAQNLNQIFQFVLRFEREKRLRFACFIIHDSEDVVHPTSLRLANFLSFYHEVVQLPVFPLQVYPTWRTFFKYLTSATYADEFAENHYRGLLVREASGAMVPSAGTGFVIARSVLDKIGTEKIFDEESLTEDYRLSLRFAQLGIPTHFFLEDVVRVLDDGRVVTEYIATREIFPNTLREAVRQKSRWIYGISFQSFSLWEILRSKTLSPIAKYSLYRDWKAKYGNLLPMPGYAVFVYFILSLLYRLPPVYPRGSLSWWLSVVLTFFMLERQIMRAIALRSVYGWRSMVAGCFVPPLLPIRIVWGNFVNFLATLRAWRIALFGFPRSRPRWQKTEHSYLSPEVLARYRRRLGDFLLEKKIISPKLLGEILREEKKGRLGEQLVKRGLISETELVECLGEIFKLGSLDVGCLPIQLRGDLLPLCRKYFVVTVAWGERSVILAASEPLSQEIVDELKRELSKEFVFVTLAPSASIARCLETAAWDSGYSLPRIGEKLLEMGLVEAEHLVEALRVQKYVSRPLGEILCDMGVVLSEDLQEVLGDYSAQSSS